MWKKWWNRRKKPKPPRDANPNALRRILFICHGNCVRSPLAEALLRFRGTGRFESCSGGTQPAGFIHPLTLKALHELDLPTGRLKSKSWKSFQGRYFDAVITLSADAREEMEAEWPVNPEVAFPLRLHWDVTDPARAQVMGEEAHLEEFRWIRDRLREKIEALCIVPDQQLKEDAAFRNLLVSLQGKVE